MTLRRRLTLAFGALVFLPLAAGGLFVAWAIPRAAEQRAEATLRSAQASVDASLISRCERAGIAAKSLGRDLALVDPQQATAATVLDRLADYAVVVDDAGRAVARAGAAPRGTDLTSLPSCRDGLSSGPAVSESVDLAIADRPRLARVTAVEDVGDAYLDSLRSLLGIAPEIALVSDGHVVAQSGAARLDLAAAASVTEADVTDGQVLRADGVQATVTRAGPGIPFDVVVGLPASNDSLLLQTVALLIAGGVLVAVITARAIARDLTGPLQELTDAAQAAATGDLTRTIEARGDEELRSLAQSFNDMTGELRAYIGEVERSRDLVRGNIERLGEALSATHDLDTLLPVVLESAMSSVGAGAGVVYVATAEGPITMHAQHGLRIRDLLLPDEVTVGGGVLGRVAAGEVVCGEVGSTPALAPSDDERITGDLLAVPLQRGGHVSGLIALFDPVLAGRFVRRDVDELQTLARQAAIAVENVQLHAEAKRASITDPLTGQWNFRYLSMTLNQEVERANRFDRPLAVLMLDLDHFKRVNDTFGHARGDDVLRELARRVRAQIREVDTFARYGGEEFVLVLPETNLDGARRLAQRIVDGVRDRPFGGAGEQAVDVTVSIGAAVFPDHGTTATHLLRAADRALYEAKHTGRDRVVVAQGDVVSSGH